MDKTKKKTIRRYILWVVMALVVVWLALMPLMARQQNAQDGPVASILSTNARVSSIRASVHGGGTLKDGDPEHVELPRDVKITGFLVKNGDMVCKGDPLAEVDKVSVLTAITQIQDSMATVRKQMESATDEKGDTTIYATAGGRVKAVYAQAGDRVESVMLEHGALAVLSLDGRMCVTISAQTDLSIGDTVTVTLENGKIVPGRVESNLIGTLSVTIEDKGYAAGQTVAVGDLGTGKLEIHCPWAATAFTGTVSGVQIKPERTLSSGASLFTLKDTDYTAQRELLANTHRDYEELLQKLFAMYDTGVISAPCDGMVSGIDQDSTHLLAAGQEECSLQLLNNQDEFRLVLLGGTTQFCTGNEECPLPGTDSGHMDGCPKACIHSDGTTACTADQHFPDCIKACRHGDTDADCPATGKHYADCIKACTHETVEGKCPAKKHYDDCIEKCIATDGCQDCPARIHKSTCIEACTHESEAGKCKATLHHYTDCIESCIISPSADTLCPASKHKDGCYFLGATYTVRVFKVSSVGTQELVGAWDPNSYDAVLTPDGWVRTDGKRFDESLAIQKGPPLPAPNAGQFLAGDVVLSITVHKGDESRKLPPVLYKRNTTPQFTMPDLNFGAGFTIPGMGGGTSGQSQLFDLHGDVLMTVTPQDTMTLTVAVDEADISDIKSGMTAEITVNALPGEVFEGEIIRVAMSGSGNGGNSKFAVEIRLPRQSRMLAGMSASAVISLYEKMNILVIPAEALTEEGGKTVVYTQLDKKTGEPVNPQGVTTGISDGQSVEILSGLSSGDAVYYRYYDTPEESDEVESNRMKMY